MSAPRNDGGPAFPRLKNDAWSEYAGMTKREYMATAIMAAWFGSGDVRERVPSFNDMARAAIAGADALIVELSK